jgi:predicted RNA-binding Zn-ribbon protein involved in translation (DUF1610 family)
MQVCHWSGKVIHETEGDARKQARKALLVRPSKKRNNVDTYHCPECRGYHVGHKRSIRARA